MAKKEKKISFKLMLLDPNPIPGGLHKVYMRITFLSQNTRVKRVLHYTTDDDLGLYWFEEDLEKWKRGETNERIEPYREGIIATMSFYERIIRYEYNLDPDFYSVLGVHRRADHYKRSVSNEILNRLRYYFALELGLSKPYDNVRLAKLLNHPTFFADELNISHMDQISENMQILTELYVLMCLNETMSKKIDPDFGNTLFDFVIQDGIKQFNKFITAFFEVDRKLKWSQISKSGQVSEKLRQLFPPFKENIEMYKLLLKQHVQILEAEG